MNPTELPTPNIPLLRQAVEWAEAEAAKTDGPCMWDQRAWATQTDCGTAYCIAGYVASTLPDVEVRIESLCECPCCKEDLVPRLRVNGELAYWSDTARAALSIADAEASALFHSENTIQRVREVAEQIAARAGERL